MIIGHASDRVLPTTVSEQGAIAIRALRPENSAIVLESTGESMGNRRSDQLLD